MGFITGTRQLNGSISFGERLTIDNSGNIGVHIPNPINTLDVGGTVRVHSNSFNHILITGSGDDGFIDLVKSGNQTASARILFDGFTDSTANRANLSFATRGASDNAAVTRMTISETGLVGIGRTPTTNKLEVNGEASKATAGSWAANSDRRIKKDISDISGSMNTMLQLHPVTFRYSDEWLKRNPEIKDRIYYNYIAQEYAKVFPNAVKGSGEYLSGDPNQILQIDTYDAGVVTVKAVQELIKENEALKSELSKMREEISEIKAALLKTASR
jgi:hypothetical protein